MNKNNAKIETEIPKKEILEPEVLPEKDIDTDEFQDAEDNPLDKLNPAELDARKKDFE
ncbi:MAG: hypothetical protein JNJ56_15015, partial [Ignavibacteria bacterium]|nr:hypothetical protein [Ignavibacteria bacterium]